MIKSVNDIKEEFKNTPLNNISKLIEVYTNDSRKSVQNIIYNYKNKIIKYEQELLRIENMKKYEKKAYLEGRKIIAGIDEVGRGPFAGPVVTACVVLPQDFNVLGINDSKKISEQKRKELFIKIKENALDISINMEDYDIIDSINILEATKKSMLKNIEDLKKRPDYLILDAINLDIDIPYISIPKADENSISVAAASIIAKVTRDEYMKEMHQNYPQYKFNINKGYGTKEHIEAIKMYGPCPIHRKTFIKKYI
ncbi:ribonuclease HII [uncultured Tyzzerella sp.]|uniref:ribonuclease HII n=1 Tax=uncultured Tyzzerella sp. TaxID=2321398 RepID=UPI0029428F2B|nr:ribonuclease HII [uncultured Tyzzerella sp.]